MHTEIKDSEPIVEETPINTELLEQISDYILRHPDELAMDSWSDIPGTIKRFFGCGTTRCIAGTAMFLAQQNGADIPNSASTPGMAQQLLGLTFAQAERLFYLQNWPSEYRNAYAPGRKYSDTAAWVTAQRIKHFIATNGEE